MSDLRARFLLLAGAALFSTGGAAIKSCGYDGFEVACLRSGLATVALLCAVPEARRGLGPRAFLVGAAFAATLILFVLATKATTAVNAILLQSAAPLYLLLLGPLVLRERISARDLAIVARAVLGRDKQHGESFPGAERPELEPIMAGERAALQ